MTIARLGWKVKVIGQGQRSMSSAYGRGNAVTRSVWNRSSTENRFSSFIVTGIHKNNVEYCTRNLEVFAFRWRLNSKYCASPQARVLDVILSSDIIFDIRWVRWEHNAKAVCTKAFENVRGSIIQQMYKICLIAQECWFLGSCEKCYPSTILFVFPQDISKSRCS